MKDLLEITPTISQVRHPSWYEYILIPFLSWNWLICTKYFQGNRRPFVMETVKADDAVKLGMLSRWFINYYCIQIQFDVHGICNSCGSFGHTWFIRICFLFICSLFQLSIFRIVPKCPITCEVTQSASFNFSSIHVPNRCPQRIWIYDAVHEYCNYIWLITNWMIESASALTFKTLFLVPSLNGLQRISIMKLNTNWDLIF